MSKELTEEEKFHVFHEVEMARVLRILKEKFGEEVYHVIAQHNGERAYEEWREIGKNSESNTIQTLVNLIWGALPEDEFEYEAVETEAGVQIKCTRCAHYDRAKALGITEETFHQLCQSDPYITKGFNENIGFQRTKTLMQGDGYCDHFYYKKG